MYAARIQAENRLQHVSKCFCTAESNIFVILFERQAGWYERYPIVEKCLLHENESKGKLRL